MAWGKGLSYLHQQREAYANSSGNRMQAYWPNAREIYEFRFTQEVNDFIVPLVHLEERTKRDGGKYTTEVLCARETYEDPKEKCEKCMSGSYKGPFFRTVTLVWVERIFHLYPPKEGQGADWKRVKRAGTDSVVYVEDVNAPRFFCFKDPIADQIEAANLGDIDLSEENTRVPTVMDRAFRIEVTGEKQSRRDILKPQAIKPPTVEQLEAWRELPSVEEVLIDKMGERKTSTKVQVTLGDDGDPGPDEPVDLDDLVVFP